MEMFREAWELLKISWKRLLKLYLISFAVAFGILGILVILGIIIYLTKFVLLVLLFIPLIILLMAVSLAVSAGMMFVVYDENIGAREAFKKGISKFLPMAAAGVLMVFFVAGGMFVFVIPAIIFGFLFIFTNYEIVLNDAGVLMAMRRSVYLVKENAGEVIKRLGAFILFTIFVTGVIPGILGVLGIIGEIMMAIYSFFLGSLYSWYSVCYFVVLYKSLKEKTPGVTGKGLWIMGVVAILGWVVFILMFGAIVSVLPGVLENINTTPLYQTEFDGV